MKEEKLRSIQSALSEEGIDAWFFVDFKGTDPLAARILGLPQGAMVTRRWFYVIPREGEPTKLCHGIEPRTLDELPGNLLLYGRWQDWQEKLSDALKGVKTLAVQYSELGVVPALGRLDAGTADFLRTLGVKLVTSGDLVARFEVSCSREQEQSHYKAMEVLLETVDATFARLQNALRSGETVNEYAVQQEVLTRMVQGGLTTDHPPIVAVGPHSADPHYAPAPTGSSDIKKDDVFLLDLWGKEQEMKDSVYADITWCAWLGTEIPGEVHEVFELVRNARDAGIAKAKETASRNVAGWEVDRATRDVIDKAGYGEYFIHRTGHSIYTDDHADGANMDDYETRDIRRLLPHTLFSIEPGVYLPGKFGIRSEVNMMVMDRGTGMTGRKQEHLPALLAD